MRKLMTLMFLFCGLTAFATIQTSDLIIYRGETYRLETNPLETYFEKYPDKRPMTGFKSSTLWRGYVATFEIVDNQLFVKDIKIMVADGASEGSAYKWRSVYQDIFPNQEGVKVDWLSEVLVTPVGKPIKDTRLSLVGFAPNYKKYTLFVIDKGDLQKVETVRYKEYQSLKNEKFKAIT